MVIMFYSETSTWRFSPTIIPTFPLCSFLPNFCSTDTTGATDEIGAQDLLVMLELQMQQVIQDLLEQQVQQVIQNLLEPLVRRVFQDLLEPQGRQVIEDLLAQANWSTGDTGWCRIT
jgi:hypothetical protein